MENEGSAVIHRGTVPVLPREAPEPTEDEHTKKQRELEEAFFADGEKQEDSDST